jgi:hypothetical protein
MPKAKSIEKHRPIISRFRELEFRALEDWRRSQHPIPGLSQALRGLVMEALTARDGQRPCVKDTST